MLAAEYQEQTWRIGFLPWSDWRGCYVIFHVKLLVFGHVRALDFLGRVRAMLSFVMIWYHHVGGIWYLPIFCVSNP